MSQNTPMHTLCANLHKFETILIIQPCILRRDICSESQCLLWTATKRPAAVTDLSQDGVLIVSDWDGFVLSCAGDNFNQPPNLGLDVE